MPPLPKISLDLVAVMRRSLLLKSFVMVYFSTRLHFHFLQDDLWVAKVGEGLCVRAVFSFFSYFCEAKYASLLSVQTIPKYVTACPFQRDSFLLEEGSV